MATISVRAVKNGDETLYRVFQGRKPMGEDQVPPRPVDGGGFKVKQDAEALRSSILRRLELKRQTNGGN